MSFQCQEKVIISFMSISGIAAMTCKVRAMSRCPLQHAMYIAEAQGSEEQK